MKYLLIGPGAIGGVTAAYMTLAGEDVTVVCRSEETAAALRTDGLRITGVRGTRTVPLRAVGGVSGLTERYDCCIVAVKAYDTADAARSALPHLRQEGLVLALQNGVCLDTLLEAVGPARAAGGVVSWSATMVSPTHMELTGEGGFTIGMAAGGPDHRLAAVRAGLAHMAPTAVTDAVLEAIYAKLIINSGITCGGALTGQLLGQMLRHGAARRFFLALVYEDMAVADAMGIRVPPFGGRLDYRRFIAGDGLTDRLRRHLTLLAVGLKYRRLKSSSLTALERGRRTEVDALNGWISEKGRALGVPTPVNDRVVALIREIEAGRRCSTPENLLEILQK